MSARDAFGPNLRRIRIQRGVSLESIAANTKVSVDLWKALERNDFSRWPSGIYARAYLRSYAEAIGVDPETTIDDFCRWFPQGDRRAGRTVREQAAIVGHTELKWRDDLSTQVDRRGLGGPLPPPTPPSLGARMVSAVAGRLLRVIGGGAPAGALGAFLRRRQLSTGVRESFSALLGDKDSGPRFHS
jgi:transcriptional regulator with XRE-family HTH domain